MTQEDHKLYTEAARVMNNIQEYFTVVIRCAKKKRPNVIWKTQNVCFCGPRKS